jgi:hypothetical protein
VTNPTIGAAYDRLTSSGYGDDSAAKTSRIVVDNSVDIMRYSDDNDRMAIQVRVNETTHLAIKALANESGDSMQGVIDKAIGRYKRELFLESLNEDFKRLRSNSGDWDEELEERRLWENTLLDGDEK